MKRADTPVATYRLQFNEQFKFQNATAILDYLRELGITDVYASPIATARKGSTHGYDVTNPQEINPEIGTVEDFEHFAAELRRRRMGLLLDIVP
ncbi:MAG TPA: alpha-amylase family glycosyl hydrolase, partial [Thermoanaerobaculia bacterium]|nr:alpha-amylase family glycosyl hydrolase [Thermoanaerobaculia bacterium]